MLYKDFFIKTKIFSGGGASGFDACDGDGECGAGDGDDSYHLAAVAFSVDDDDDGFYVLVCDWPFMY